MKRTRLVEDLRSLLKDGATPSRLIQEIINVVGTSISYSELCDVLRDAFHLPIVRISPSSVGPRYDPRGVALNKTMLVELVQHKDDWGGGDSHDQPNGKSWMDGLTPRGVDEILAEVKSAPVPGLSQESWSALSPQEQSALHSHLNGALILSERVEALARLAERLQEKVNELEAARPACVR